MKQDLQIFNLIKKEEDRQTSGIELIASENYVSEQVLEALGVSCEGKIRLNTKTLGGKTCQITVETDANDESRQIVTRVSKILTTQEATVAASPFIQPTHAPVAGNNVAPMNPSPSEPVAAPAQPEPAAPQGNLPPWMQNAQAQASITPQGNLPPWMRQQ